MSVIITAGVGALELAFSDGRKLNIPADRIKLDLRPTYVYLYEVGNNRLSDHKMYDGVVKLTSDDVSSPVYGDLAALYAGLKSLTGIAIAAAGSGGSVVITPPSSIGNVANTAVGVTEEQIVVASTPCKKVVVTASHTNSGYITVGGVGLNIDQGIILYAADSIELEIDDVNKIYVTSSVADENVSATYFN